MGSTTSSSNRHGGHREPSYPMRHAQHAGSWYSNQRQELDDTLSRYLETAAASSTSTRTTTVRALIVPHAGYSYSGPTAAHAYHALAQSLQQNNNTHGTKITKIVVLHPSHHVYLDGCAISNATVLETPLGNLQVDEEFRQELLQTGQFTLMEQHVDENEHSGELQYPYLAKLLSQSAPTTSNNDDEDVCSTITVTPIMCGALSVAQETHYGQILADVLAQPNVVTVVSSDFCHWGSRFSYRPMDTTTSDQKVPIHEYIAQLDRQGMDLIELQQPGAFADYLKQTRNTICGRHAIAVWLRAVNATNDPNILIQFVKYDQSSAVTAAHESSVSYAAAVATLEPPK